jgi:hypothetical protein
VKSRAWHGVSNITSGVLPHVMLTPAVSPQQDIKSEAIVLFFSQLHTMPCSMYLQVLPSGNLSSFPPSHMPHLLRKRSRMALKSKEIMLVCVLLMSQYNQSYLYGPYHRRSASSRHTCERQPECKADLNILKFPFDIDPDPRLKYSV